MTDIVSLFSFKNFDSKAHQHEHGQRIDVIFPLEEKEYRHTDRRGIPFPILWFFDKVEA